MLSETSTALTVERLAALVAAREIDTVVVGITDMQGRLQGKRFAAAHFLEDVVTGGTEGCNYLLAVDVEMNTVLGYAMSSWERGYGDFVMVPDVTTLRLLALAPRDGILRGRPAMGRRDPGRGLAAPDPRPPGRAPGRARLARRSRPPSSSSSCLNDTFEQAWQAGYRALTPANLYNVDYSLFGTGRVEPLLRQDPQRDGRGRHVGRVGQGRVQPGPARDRLQIHGPCRKGRRALAFQDGSQGDRRPGGLQPHLHGQVRLARGQLLPRPHLAS